MSSSEKTIGEALKDRREDLKITIEEVSRTLKVKVNDIIFLEQNSIHLINQGLYLKGFIKSYCLLLKIKDETIQDYIKNITQSCNTKNNKYQLINLHGEASSPSKDYLINALIVLVMTYLLLVSFDQFKSKNSSITDLIINQLGKIE